MGTRDDRFAEIANSLKGQYVTAEQLVESFIRAAISNGVYRPGERITQETVAQILGVSRIPVRAGLRQLEADGLVTVVPHRGATVVSISASDVAEIFELRKVLECYLLECCVPRLSDEGIGQLQQLVASGEMAPAEQFDLLQMSFYEKLFSYAERPRAVKMFVGLRTEIERYRLTGRLLDADTCHSELLVHLAARDVGACQAWIRRHLDTVSKAVQALVESSEVEVADSGPGQSIASRADRQRILAGSAGAAGHASERS